MRTITSWHVSTLGLIIGRDKPTNNGAVTIESAMEELLELRRTIIRLEDEIVHTARLAEACQKNCAIKHQITEEKQILACFLRDRKEKQKNNQGIDRSENRAIIDDPFLIRI